MFRFVLVILLVNTYGLSFGLPVGQQTGNGTMIGNLLSELAKQCKNEFVAGIINSKMNECNLGIPPITESSIRCSMFYDASTVLCNLTTNTSKLVTDFAAKTKTNQDLSKFCDEAAHFNLPPTRFHTNITEVLHKETACTIVCADDDILSGGTSFYCNYYKWMLEIVQSHINPVINIPPASPVAVDGQKKINDTLVTDAVSTLDRLPKKDEDKLTSSDTNNNISTNDVDTNKTHVKAAQPSLATGAVQTKLSNISETQLENSFDDAQLNKLDENGAIHIESVLLDNGGHDKKNKEGVHEEDDQDQDVEENEDHGDTVGEGMDDIDVENRPDNSGQRSGGNQEAPPLKIDSESSHGDTYQTDGYTDDDDHFFPFFLTVVIVVVVLYVLYHNKNKVSKMFFGLIVEGRQSGRRRTSRGHAYRRLDTLEQAMSANTAAPPSKIIY